MNALLRWVTIFGVMLGSAGALLALWALVDPVGMRQSIGANPFAPPPGWAESAYAFAFSLAVAVFSAHRLRSGDGEEDEGDDEQ